MSFKQGYKRLEAFVDRVGAFLGAILLVGIILAVAEGIYSIWYPGFFRDTDPLTHAIIFVVGCGVGWRVALSKPKITAPSSSPSRPQSSALTRL